MDRIKKSTVQLMLRQLLKLLLKQLFMLTVLVLSLTLTGCWDNLALEDQLLSLGLAIDVAPQDDKWLLVTVGFPSNAKDAKESYTTHQSVGETVSDALKHINTNTYRQLRFGHTMIFIFSEAIAKQGGVMDHLGGFARDTREGPLMDLAVCKGEAATLIQAQFPQITLTPLFYSDLITQGGELGFLKRPLLWNFMRDIKEKGISATLPYIDYLDEVAEVRNGKIALFKEDKMVGIMSGDQAKILTAAHSRTHKFGGTLVTTDMETGHKIALRPTSGVADIEVSKDEQGIKANLRIEVKGDLLQFSAPTVSGYSSIERIEQVIADYLFTVSHQVIGKLQQDFKTDSLGVGLSVRAKYPEFFNTVADDWDSYFVNMPISVTAEVDVVSVGTRR